MNPIAGMPEPLLLGLHAFGELAKEPDKCLTTKHLADIIGTSEPYLSKILQRLCRCGLIKSVRGPGGGYKLNCVPSETPLYPIFEVLGGPFKASGCKLEGCRGKKCFIGEMMDELSRAFFRYLASRSVAEFASYYANGTEVSIEISVVTPSLGQRHPNFGNVSQKKI